LDYHYHHEKSLWIESRREQFPEPEEIKAQPKNRRDKACLVSKPLTNHNNSDLKTIASYIKEDKACLVSTASTTEIKLSKMQEQLLEFSNGIPKVEKRIKPKIALEILVFNLQKQGIKGKELFLEAQKQGFPDQETFIAIKRLR
jgi:hypothetical protein